MPADPSPPIPPSELIGNGTARELCGGVSRHTLLAWRRTKGFPEPVAKIDRTEIWDRRAVKAWWKTAKRDVMPPNARAERGRRR